MDIVGSPGTASLYCSAMKNTSLPRTKDQTSLLVLWINHSGNVYRGQLKQIHVI